MKTLFNFELNLKHDKGYTFIEVVAESYQAAIKRVMDSEKCPERSIKTICRISEVAA